MTQYCRQLGRRAESILPLLVLLATWGLFGCGLAIQLDRPPHGSFAPLLGATTAAHAPSGPFRPLAILVTRRGLHALDPTTRTTLWRSPLRPTAHMSANRRMVFVPVSGHRVVALDRRDGRHRWARELPGEALIGISASDDLLVATTTGGHGRRRNAIVAFAGDDGQRLWVRPLADSPGVPAVGEGWVAFPLKGQLVALHGRLGREIARTGLPADTRWQRAEFRNGSLAVWSRYERLAIAGTARPARFKWSRVLPGYDTAAADPGHDDSERLRWFAAPAAHPEGVIAVVAQIRRALVGIEANKDGAPVRVRWIHLASPGEEYVGGSMRGNSMTLVSENGSIAERRADTGEMIGWWRRQEPTHGAMLLEFGHPAPQQPKFRDTHLDDRSRGPPPSTEQLLADPDPRLYPVQSLIVRIGAASLHTSEVHQAVRRLAAGELRETSGEVTRELVAQAKHLLSDPVAGTRRGAPRDRGDPADSGEPSNSDDPGAIVLAQGPAFVAADPATRKSVSALLHAFTAAETLPSVVASLCEDGGGAALASLMQFAWRYHSDPATVAESSAVIDAIRCLMDHPDVATQRQLARIALDPFTDARVRRQLAPPQVPPAGELP
ncbi:MAG: PQQ-binding-like beta-propeller repeat protein [Nannocystaceae bacterium]